MQVKSAANGNIIDLPEDHGLVAAGIYVPVEGTGTPPSPAPTPPTPTPPGPVGPLTTADMPTKKAKK